LPSDLAANIEPDRARPSIVVDAITPPGTAISPSQHVSEVRRYTAVGGWLKFFCFTLLVSTPIGTALVVVSEYNILSPLFSQDATMLYLFVIETLLCSSLAVYSFYAGVQLGRLHPTAIRTAKRLLMATLGYHLLIIGFGALVDPTFENMGEASGTVFRGFMYFAIWYTYLGRSKRVQQTFPRAVVQDATLHTPHRFRLATTAALMLLVGALLGLGASLRQSTGHLTSNVTAPSANGQPVSNEWKEYISSVDDFSVTFPGTPAKTETTESVRGRSIPIRFYELASPDGVEYAVMAATYPTELSVAASPLGALAGVVQTIAENSDGRVRTESATRVEGYPASDVVIDADEGVIRARAIVAGDRVYLLMQAVHDDDDAKGSYARFRESFDISPR
jgi:hypothetical protein